MDSVLYFGVLADWEELPKFLLQLYKRGDVMKMLFCNIGWMDRYKGKDGDSIYGGGSFNENNIGSGAWNFSPAGDNVYGYVHPNGQIRIENIGGDDTEESISGVTVVWTAPHENGGTWVVGWYRNATVYRQPQKNGQLDYYVMASFNDATLLPPNERNCEIPRGKGGMGQSNVWYANSPEGKETIAAVNRLIAKDILDRSPDVDADSIIAGKEGSLRFALHLRRERNQKLVKAKREEVRRKTGKLSCEVCGFDFAKVYNEVGEGFCEVHHLTPLAQADGEGETTLDDLAIVCSNCHRMLHRGKPIFTIEELQSRLRRP